MASYGPAMQVVGRYRVIQRPDGTEPDLDHFLAIGAASVVDAHAFKVDELPLDTFDPQTRFAIFWLEPSDEPQCNKGEAVFHAQSSELRIDELAARILHRDRRVASAHPRRRPRALDDRSSIIEVARALARLVRRRHRRRRLRSSLDSGRAADDAHLWATVGELVRQLPDSDRVAVALTACQRNRRAIEAECTPRRTRDGPPGRAVASTRLEPR